MFLILRACILATLTLIWASVGVVAQDLTTGTPKSPILTIESDRLFSQSAYGQRVLSDLEQQGAAIAAENRQIEADLTAEELELTERRSQLTGAAFRTLATEFDEKVQRLRREQDTKARALGRQEDGARVVFLNAIQPILEQIMRESGAAVILDRRNVFIRVDVIDVTSLAIERIDNEIGDGTELDAARDNPQVQIPSRLPVVPDQTETPPAE